MTDTDCPDPADHALADAVREHRDAILGALRTAMTSLPIEVKATAYIEAIAALEDKP